MITASVVLYKTPVDDLKTVLKSFSPTEDRILFVVDNSPVPGYEFLREEKNVEYIFNNANLGYGRANNIAIRKAAEIGAAYHVVLNPDLKFSPEVIDKLAEYADCHRDVLYMLPRIVNENGETQKLCKLLPKPADLIFRRFLPFLPAAKKNNALYTLEASGYNTLINPPCLSGCFMFLRLPEDKGLPNLFDERFFMYCEDFDLIRRLHRNGKTLYYPLCTVQHRESKSSYADFRMLLHHIASAVRYFNKYGWIKDPERDEMNQKILKELGLK